MNWLIAAFGAFFLWGGYTLFGNKATAIHGGNVTMAFETAMFIILTLVVTRGSWGDFARITSVSAFHATVMGLMSAGGFYFLLKALELAPGRVATITLISAVYPVLTIAIVALILKLRPEWLPEAEPLTPLKFVGSVVVIVGLVLVNWDPRWNSAARGFGRQVWSSIGTSF